MLRSSLACLLLVLCPAAAALADRAPNPPPPPVRNNHAPLVIKTDGKASNHRIIIPRQFLAGAKVSQLDDAGSGRTMLAGLLMSLAVGAAVFVRRSGRLAAAVLVLGMLLAGSATWADIRPDPPQRRITIEVVEKGDTVTLVVPAERRFR